ncbi:unnamed protein product [Gordionus sp. m RMFG-2023]|uniref:ubiquitin domain-containing protein UBFD1-like n=1 Tax=Gordionus sp. m RMFG-2023 TaxID=3053472 RepID=UPI0030E37C8A
MGDNKSPNEPIVSSPDKNKTKLIANNAECILNINCSTEIVPKKCKNIIMPNTNDNIPETTNMQNDLNENISHENEANHTPSSDLENIAPIQYSDSNNDTIKDSHIIEHTLPDISGIADPETEKIITIKILFKKEKYDIPMKLSATIKDLKEEVNKKTGLHTTLQKIMFKGLTKDEQTLKDLNAVEGSKFMVIGSTLNDIMSIRPPDKILNSALGALDDSLDPSKSDSHLLCKQKLHMKVLDKGKPDDTMVGIKNIKAPLPLEPLSGMLERGGGKVRLTFKLELDQLWIGTKDRTQKIPLNSIVNVVSEAIQGQEEYHIMGIQLGPTEASRYWIYWVPAQYIDAIKKAVFG